MMFDEGEHRDAAHGFGLKHVVLTVLALAYVLFADYTALMLAGLTCVFFAFYLGFRFLAWFQADRFTPKRLRVGATWALVGIDGEADEYDSGPARTYFSLLLILFAGLVLRPVLGWIL